MMRLRDTWSVHRPALFGLNVPQKSRVGYVRRARRLGRQRAHFCSTDPVAAGVEADHRCSLAKEATHLLFERPPTPFSTRLQPPCCRATLVIVGGRTHAAWQMAEPSLAALQRPMRWWHRPLRDLIHVAVRGIMQCHCTACSSPANWPCGRWCPCRTVAMNPQGPAPEDPPAPSLPPPTLEKLPKTTLTASNRLPTHCPAGWAEYVQASAHAQARLTWLGWRLVCQT
jgi:hypothetical protein